MFSPADIHEKTPEQLVSFLSKQLRQGAIVAVLSGVTLTYISVVVIGVPVAFNNELVGFNIVPIGKLFVCLKLDLGLA